jgi:hypothetical protein
MKFESPIDTVDNVGLRKAGSEALLKEVERAGAKYPNKRAELMKELIERITPEERDQMDAEFESKASQLKDQQEVAVYHFHKEHNNVEEQTKFLLQRVSEGLLKSPF